MSLRVKKAELFLTNLQSRLPFRYGIAVMKGLPHCVVRVQLQDGERVSDGVGADNLAPKWFTKNPETTFQHDADEMIKVIEHACSATEKAGSGGNVFELWTAVYDQHQKWADAEKIPPLLANFGFSLVERAVIDAFLRGRELTLAAALSQNVFGLDLGYFHEALRSRDVSDFLPGQPVREVYLRHTLGLSDPLTEKERTDDPRVDDGLPVSLEECIRSQGLRYFKLKIQGKIDIDLERLRHTAAVIRAHAPRDYLFTLDGNEQYKSYDDLRRLFELMRKDREMAEFLEHLIFVEQPLYRGMALNDEVAKDMKAWPDHPPVIIDESDGALEDFERALALGYSGVSHKNCKGIFKGIAHGCLVKHLQRKFEGRKFFQSGEDLTNVGPIALLQDLSVMAHLGIDHVERNGQHYFAGLAFLPPELQEVVLKNHPDLFYRHPRGYVTLRIEQGKIQLGSLFNHSLGLQADLGTKWLTPKAAWAFDERFN
jgi:hypothetical protein